jgi:hypothetical protein
MSCENLELKYNRLYNAALELRKAQEKYLSRPEGLSKKEYNALGLNVANAAERLDFELGRKGMIFDENRKIKSD